MPSLNPCCGVINLKTAAKTVAVFQVVISLGALVLTAVAIAGQLTISTKPTSTPKPPLISRTVLGATDEGGDRSIKNETNWIIFLALVLTLIIVFFTSINLFSGARAKIRTKCKMWIVINAILFVLVGVTFGYLCFNDADTVILTIIGVGAIIHGYFIVVVNAFTQEL